MIQSITLKDFQAHEYMHIDFDEQITSIVGPSDIGKSAIIRAFRWVALNRPSGDAFIRHGADGAEVTVVTEAHTVIRRRNKSENVYIVDGTTLASFGTDVPQEVRDALGLADINFQGQHDTPYWLGLSAGEVSRAMNEIVDLDIIDLSMKNINAGLKKARIEEASAQEAVDEAHEASEALAYVADMAQDFEAVELWEKRLTGVQTKIDGLSPLIEKIVANNALSERLTACLDDAFGLTALSEEYERLEADCDRLADLIEQVEEHQQNASIEIPNMAPLVTAQDAVNQAMLRRQALAQIIKKAQEQETQICQLKNDFQKTEKTYRQLIGNVCPLCGSKIKQSQ